MLVDLGRNDLSRVCVPGTVQVKRFMEPERYSHVTHLVSEVVGELRDGVTPFELLRATFPAGTVSGAPKVRAMQIISELEGYRRGIYAGAVGYYLPENGELDTCIAIRTLWLRDGVAHLQAGGGIVADSDPGAEHEECLAKLRALETAIELAESEQDAAQGVGR
jgi:anthranilate synthase component 1